jgi:hypothetical protein
LGKTRLQKAAEEIETCLSGENPLVTPEQLSLFEAELNAALAEFTSLAHKTVSPRPVAQAEPLDAERKQALMEELKTLLEEGNPACLDLVDSLCLLPGSEELIQRMENFDFEAALETLAALKREWV